MGTICEALEIIKSEWRTGVLYAVCLSILWAGFSQIDDIYETYRLACDYTVPHTRCPGIHTEFLGLITVLAAVCFPYALGKWWDLIREQRSDREEAHNR